MTISAVIIHKFKYNAIHVCVNWKDEKGSYKVSVHVRLSRELSSQNPRKHQSK